MRTLEELREIASSDDPERLASKWELASDRIALVESNSKLLRAATDAGRGLLASEKRQFDHNSEILTALDRAAVAVGRRAEESAAIRARHPDMFGGDTGTPSGSAFGERIREAIAEVRDGRATAYVDAPRETRTLLDAGDAGSGVGLQMAQPVDTLRAKSVVMSLPGLRTEPMTSDRMRWPRIGAATVGGIAEATALTAAATVHNTVDVVAAKYGTIEYLSTELAEDYSAPALQVFGDNLLSWLALKVDLGLLEGDGSGPGIVGMRNTAGVNSTSVAGTITMAKYRQAEYELRLDNGNPTCWVTHPRVWKQSQDIVTGIASDTTTVLSPNQQIVARTLLGYPVFMSTQITLVEGATNVGSWAALVDTSQIVVCERRQARLEVSRDFAFDTDRIAIRATWRGGLAVLNPEAVSLLTDIR